MELLKIEIPSTTIYQASGAIENVDDKFEVRYKQKNGGYVDLISEKVPDGKSWTVHLQVDIEET